ncbi:MAG: hypothetical protein IPL81_16900 [Flavobacteriales bacterium]|jgi:hypothetical protein|nr:hypothetical protein [Flavobacteriales bacterium]MBK7287238.1 hypothetical protein [Flavobacteriales bacterium]MBK9061459.1 hypothetical protein [Flavobacteriales bacterium]QQS72541.1 MAG: hypothetical protein IPP95_15460 [Flavobacteriales bacterium]HQV39096.1 hypothetical protein [Flavobacteriales bacterium]
MTFETTAKVSLTLEQVLEVVKQLPAKAKLRIAKELEQDGVKAEWDFVFGAFKSRELDMATINKAVEAERAKAYAKRRLRVKLVVDTNVPHPGARLFAECHARIRLLRAPYLNASNNISTARQRLIEAAGTRQIREVIAKPSAGAVFSKAFGSSLPRS